jgi:hypothetical protein
MAVENQEGAAQVPARQAMFSPAGWIVVLFIVVIEAIMVFFLSNYMSAANDGATGSGSGEVVDERGGYVNLEHIYAKIPNGPRPEDQVSFVIRPTLELNPSREGEELDVVRGATAEIKHKISNIMEKLAYKDIITAAYKNELAKRIRQELERDFPDLIKAVWIEEYQYE